MIGEPPTLDPYSEIATDLTFALDVPVYPMLYRLLPDGATEPYLAKSLRERSGGAIVQLREMSWSDGSPVTADDVVASFERASPRSGFSTIASARATGPHTVVFEGRVSDWANPLARIAFVLPGGAASDRYAGPFRIATQRSGYEIVYRRNPQWTGPPAYLRTLTVRFVSDLEALLTLLDRGRLDAAVPPATVNLGDRLTRMGVESEAKLGWESIQLELSPALDEASRVGVAQDINREALEVGLVRGDGRISHRVGPAPGPDGASGPWSTLAGREGRKPDRSVTLAAPDGDELLGLLQRAIQIQLDQHHIRVDSVATDDATFYGEWRVSPPNDIAIERSAGAPGMTPARTGYKDMTAYPLFEVATYLAWREGVNGLSVNPTVAGPLWNATQWWVARP